MRNGKLGSEFGFLAGGEAAANTDSVADPKGAERFVFVYDDDSRAETSGVKRARSSRVFSRQASAPSGLTHPAAGGATTGAGLTIDSNVAGGNGQHGIHVGHWGACASDPSSMLAPNCTTRTFSPSASSNQERDR